MEKSSKFWLKVGHWWRRVLRDKWPEIYTSHRELLAERAARKQVQETCDALQRRVDALHGEIATGSGELAYGLSAMEAEYQRLIAEHDQKCQAAITRLQQENANLRRMSEHDPLTGLLSRRGLESGFKREVGILSRSLMTEGEKRHSPTMTVVMMDLDNFKLLNDTSGHAAGDAALKVVAELITTFFGRRPADMVCRWGGDEFIVIMPEASTEYVQKRAQQFLEAMRADVRLHLVKGGLRVTASIGIARVNIESDSTSETILRELLKDLVRRADVIAYEAKSAGRNTIRLAGDITRWSGLDQ